MRPGLHLLSGASLALLSLGVCAEDRASDWLVRMSDAARNVN